MANKPMIECTYCQVRNAAFNPQCKVCGKDLPLLGSDEGNLDQKVEPQPEPFPSLLAQDQSLPHRMGRYELVRHLGSGLHTQVFEANDMLIRRKVVIKAFPGMVQTTAGDQTPFLKEARALAALNHPHIAQIYDVIQLANMPCLVMESVMGRSVLEKACHPKSRFIRLTNQVLQALATAHQAGLIHRDLKPDHILVTADDSVKLIDFGLVKRFGPAMDSLPSTPLAEAWRGTPAYMAPEQIADKRLDWRSDMFSLALIWSEWLVGAHPFAGANLAVTLHNICHNAPKLESRDRPPMDPRLGNTLRRALAKSPGDRWPSLLDFKNQLIGDANIW